MKYKDLSEREILQKGLVEDLSSLCDNSEDFRNKVWRRLTDRKTDRAMEYALKDTIKIANDAIEKGIGFLD